MWISFSTSPSISAETGMPVQLRDDLGDVLVVDLLLEEACVDWSSRSLGGLRLLERCSSSGISP